MVHTNDLSRKSPEGLLLAPGQELATGGRGLPGLWGGSTQWDRGCDRGDHWVLSGTERVPNPAWGKWGGYKTPGRGQVVLLFLCWSSHGFRSSLGGQRAAG